MRLIRTQKERKCKKCRLKILTRTFYYPQRRKKAICFKCGYKKKKGFINWAKGVFNNG